MKKILCLVLALALALSVMGALVSCGDELPEIYKLAQELEPTRTVTSVEYIDKDGKKLEGWYDLQVEGENSVFSFKYDRYRTVEEALEENTKERIKTVEGVVYCRDGKYSGDGFTWSSAPVSTDIKLNLDPSLLIDPVISEDGRTLTATVSSENIEAVAGSTLSAVGDISLVATTNGTYFTGVVLTCTTIQGATLTVRASYSRNAVDLEPLFPEE